MTGEPHTDEVYVTKHELEFMNPVDAVRAHAYGEIMAVRDSLMKAHISEQQITVAADLRAKEATAQFEALQQQDPLRRIIEVLKTTATREEEKNAVDSRTRTLESWRGNWQNSIKETKIQKRMQSGSEPTTSSLLTNIVVDSPGIFTYDDPDGTERLYFHIAGNQGKSDEYMNKVLHALGALKPDEQMSDLKYLPRDGWPRYRPPIIPKESHHDLFDGSASGVSTNIPGVRLRIDLEQKNIFAGFDMPTFEKVLTCPASV